MNGLEEFVPLVNNTNVKEGSTIAVLSSLIRSYTMVPMNSKSCLPVFLLKVATELEGACTFPRSTLYDGFVGFDCFVNSSIFCGLDGN